MRPKTGAVNLHFDQRVYLRSICRFMSVYGVFPRGWGKCVAGDTRIFTNRGIIKIRDLFDCEENGIEDYASKMNIRVVNGDTNRAKSSYGTYNGYKDTKKIKTSGGIELECSYNHPLKVLVNGEPQWVMAEHLKVGDKVLVSVRNDLWGKETKLNLDKTKIENISPSKIPTELTPRLARFLGIIMASGYVDAEFTNMFLGGIDNECSKMFFRRFARYDLNNRLSEKESSADFSYKNIYPRFNSLFRELGIDYKTVEDKRIPEYIFKAPREIVVEFLNGVFDTTSGIEKNRQIQIQTRSKTFAQQLQILLLNLNIFASLKSKMKNGYKSYSLRMGSDNFDKFALYVGYNEKKKRERIVEFWNDKYNPKKPLVRYMYDKIESIENSKNHVYDISVCGMHSFISNGLVSHNTWGEVISLFVIAILYPGITLSLTAQTKANAAELLKDKYDEITRQYPLLKNEMFKPRVAKDDFELRFVNGSRIDVLANAQSSKGQRRNRIQIEESALIDNYTYEDALKPIVEIGRTTNGKLGIIDPLELNQQINFFTTSG